MTMTIADWKGISRQETETTVSSWLSMPPQEFDALRDSWQTSLTASLDDEYSNLREELVEAYSSAVQQAKGLASHQRKNYHVDLVFGMRLYQILIQYGLSARTASYDPVWMYLVVRVIPDIVVDRWTRSDGSIAAIPDHSYKKLRRIYPKAMWWYLHLSLQLNATGNPDYAATYRILKDNTTDDIMNLVERSGLYGYRVDVYRELMRYYGIHRSQFGPQMLRKVLVLHVARVKLVEPELHSGGVRGYVTDLFEEFDE